ncbi:MULTISPECIES: glycosyltransferase family A protein [Bacillaceae]|uniref:glycosyltransferase family 2 protein n=1 Tax=Bacillaceae TaxID=186817 RepID=UPI001BDF5174|nr:MULTISPECIES: glycosyltransferase family A protein [Bacillaceae]MDX8361114.1 glycosyltransferase family A protein [Cytobacillus sp. IB215316]
MSCYNAAEIIGRTIESISSQQFQDYELIIVDDYSTDNTVEAIEEKITLDPRMTLIKNTENIGLTKSLIKAVRLSHGEYIARIDAGDLMHPERLRKQKEILDEHDKVGLVTSYCNIIKMKDGIMIEQYNKVLEAENIKKSMALGNRIEHCTTMFRRSIYDEVGGYNKKYYTSQDYDLWVKMLHTSSLYVIPETLSTSVYDISNSITYNKNKVQLRNGIKIRVNAMKNNYLPKKACMSGIIKALLMYILPGKVNTMLRNYFSPVKSRSLE